MNKVISAILVAVFLMSSSVSFAAASDTDSLNVTGKRVKIVAKSALYGFGGGLVVGLASQVFKRKTKNIFLFGSLGLYAGIILGIYVISTSSGPAPYEGPDTYEDFGWNKSVAPGQLARMEKQGAFSQPQVQANFLSVNF